MCTHSHTVSGLGSLAVSPAAGGCPASSRGHTSPRGPTLGAGTQAPHKHADTHYRWDVALDPLPISWSPEPPVLHTQIHTLTGVSARPQSLCSTWPGLPAPPAGIRQMHTGFSLDFMATPKSLLLLPLLLHCPQSSHHTHAPSPDPATWALVTHGQIWAAGTDTPIGTYSIEPFTQ